MIFNRTKAEQVLCGKTKEYKNAQKQMERENEVCPRDFGGKNAGTRNAKDVYT